MVLSVGGFYYGEWLFSDHLSWTFFGPIAQTFPQWSVMFCSFIISYSYWAKTTIDFF